MAAWTQIVNTKVKGELTGAPVYGLKTVDELVDYLAAPSEGGIPKRNQNLTYLPFVLYRSSELIQTEAAAGLDLTSIPDHREKIRKYRNSLTFKQLKGSLENSKPKPNAFQSVPYFILF